MRSRAWRLLMRRCDLGSNSASRVRAPPALDLYLTLPSRLNRQTITQSPRLLLAPMPGIPASRCPCARMRGGKHAGDVSSGPHPSPPCMCAGSPDAWQAGGA